MLYLPMLLAACSTVAPPPIPADPLTLTPIATLAHGAGKEVSGLVASRAHPGVFWAVNDSGNRARIYPVWADGSLTHPARPTEHAGVRIPGAANTDWEDIALDASNNLIIADLGNNANDRRDLAILIVAEPDPAAEEAPGVVRIPVRYPDQSEFPPPSKQHNFDAEAVFTVGDDVFILTKDRGDTFTKLYRLDSRFPDRPNTLTYLDRFDVHSRVSGADATPDGRRLAVLTHDSVWVFERTDPREAFFAGRVRRRMYRPADGGPSSCESIAFESPDALLIADEAHGHLFRVPLTEVPEVSPGRDVPPGDPAADLRVMSFNLRYANTHDGPNNWALRRPLVADTLAAFDPDILGCQEVLAEQADWLRETLKDRAFIGVGRLDGKREGEFSPILCRAERFLPLGSGWFWLSETPDVPGAKGWDAACERIATWARVRDTRTGRTLLLLNTHLDHIGQVARRKGLELIGSRLAALAEGAEVIVTGDFNTSADSPLSATLTAEAPGRPPLRDTFRAVYPTRDADELTFCDWKGQILGDRIDWILASPTLAVIDAAIDRRMPEGRTPSDHYPVTAVLRFPTAPKAPSADR